MDWGEVEPTGVHIESGDFVVAPPAGEAVAFGRGVAFMHEYTGNAAGATT